MSEHTRDYYPSYAPAPSHFHVFRWIALALLVAVMYTLWRIWRAAEGLVCGLPLVGWILCGSSPLGALGSIAGSALGGIGSAAGTVGGGLGSAVGTVGGAFGL